MKLVTVLSASTLLALTSLLACGTNTVYQPAPGNGSSGTATPDDQTKANGTSEGDDDDGTGGGLTGDGVGNANAAPDKNAAGDAYPTKGIGTQVGKVIRNYKFLGYPDANVEGGLKPISLAQFFDPSGSDIKLIHIQAAGSWCSACRGETRALVPIAEELVKRKVIWVVSLAEGPTPGSPSKTTDLNTWISDFNSPFTHVLDPANKNLGPFYDRSALPWNANIDAKTMKIITAGTGGAQQADRILEEIDDALAQIQ
jgi:hypothetical protein